MYLNGCMETWSNSHDMKNMKILQMRTSDAIDSIYEMLSMLMAGYI